MSKPRIRKIRNAFVLTLALGASVASGAFASDWVISHQNSRGEGYYAVAPGVVASSAALVKERAELAVEIGK